VNICKPPNNLSSRAEYEVRMAKKQDSKIGFSAAASQQSKYVVRSKVLGTAFDSKFQVLHDAAALSSLMECIFLAITIASE